MANQIFFLLTLGRSDCCDWPAGWVEWLAGVGGRLAQCCMPQLLRLAVFRPRADSLAMSCSRLAGLLTGRLGAPCVAGWHFFLLGIMGVVESQGEGKGASDL